MSETFLAKRVLKFAKEYEYYNGLADQALRKRWEAYQRLSRIHGWTLETLKEWERENAG